MNPDQPAREEIEAKLTALLLGELPEEEAKLLRWAIAQNPQLEKLHDELKLTIGLVREVASRQSEPNLAENAALKLSESRRQELLELFKTPRARELVPPLKRRQISPFFALAAAVVLIAVLAALLLPALSAAKRKSQHDFASASSLGEQRMDSAEARLPADERSAAGAPIPQPVEDGPQIVTTSELKKAPAPPPTTEIVLPQPQPASMPTFAFGSGVAGNGGGGGGGGGGVSTTFAFATPPPASSSPGSPASISGKIIESPAPVAHGASTFAERLNSIYVRKPANSQREQNASQELADNFDAAFQQAGSQQGGSAFKGDTSQDKRFLALPPPASPGKDNTAYGFNFPPSEKVPLLGDLPVLGNTFKSHSQASQASSFDANTGLPVAAASLPPASTWNAYAGEPTTSLPSGGAIAVGSLAPIAEQPKVVPPPTQVPAMSTPPQPIARAQNITAYQLVLSPRVSMNAPAVNQTAAPVVTNAVPIATSEAWAPAAVDEDRLTKTSPPPAPVFTPEIQTSSNSFSTFAMNVSDVSFKLAEASLQNGRMPDAASIRSEEFVNAFDYRDPEALPGVAVAFTSERARDPFAQNCDLLRLSIKTAASGRAADRPLNLVLLLDNSGSMERADRVAIIRAALRVLGAQLHSRDTVSVVTFARTARLWVDGVSGDQAGAIFDEVGGLTPQGGTNLEEAMRLAYATARRHYLANGMNRVVLLTDGAANLGNVDPNALKQKVETNRRQGIALDCFGIGWEDYNDDLLELLSSNGDGRYAFLNSPDDVSNEFAAKLAGALQVAAEDVKVQVEFNPARVTAWRQIGYASHQLSQEQFRDNTVAAGAIAAREAGNALYTVRVNPQGDGPLATVRVRYRIPGTTEVREQAWDVAYTGGAVSLEQSSAAMRLAAVAGEFAEWLEASPSAQEVTPDELLRYLSGTPETYGADPRPKQLEWMIRQAQSLSGK